MLTGPEPRGPDRGLRLFLWAVEGAFVLTIVAAVLVALTLEPAARASAVLTSLLLAAWVWVTRAFDES